jgi:hypothetical protein
MSNNRSLNAARMELGDQAELLKFLPFHRATFQAQTELPGAAPDRLLYGDMMEEKDQLWCYFTLLGGGDNYNQNTGGNRMISFYTLKGAQSGGSPFHSGQIKASALASQPFKLARGQREIAAIAKYFFIKRGVDKVLVEPLSIRSFKADLLRACGDYKAAHARQQLVKQGAAGGPRPGIDAPTAPSGPRHEQQRGSDEALSRDRPASFTTEYDEGTASTGGWPEENNPYAASSREQMAAPSSHQSWEHQDAPSDTRKSPSQYFNANNPRKRTRSPSNYTNGQSRHNYSPSVGKPQRHYPPSPQLAHNTPVTQPVQASDTPLDRETTMEEYIALQRQEEEVDRKLQEVEEQRAEVASQMVGLQARLNEVNNKKWDLMDEKDKIKEQKRRLQGSLERDDQLDFGFEAGRRMARESESDSKRARRE